MSPQPGRRAAGGLLVLALVAALLAGAFAAESRAGGRPDAPSRLLVNASEWSYVLSRAELPPGPSIVELYNRGEDPHDLTIRKNGGTRTWTVGETLPGAGGAIELRLRRGSRYRLWCTLPAHRERGMEARLKVTRKRR